MRTIFISLFFFAAIPAATAQSMVKGTVYNEQGAPVDGASVVLYMAADSAMDRISLTLADGSFIAEPSAAGRLFLEISYVGLQTFQSEVLDLSNGATVDLGKITMKASDGQVLAGVVLTARKPLIERKLDKLVVNVESSISASSGTALELLEKAPGVEVDKDGNISMRGKSGVLVLVDDRPTYMKSADLANYLKTLPASSLSQLEIMTNPSAKYDASGNSGIINIRTKQIKKSGMNGSVNLAGRIAQKGVGSASLTMNYRKNKVNLFGTYSSFAGTFLNDNYITRRFRESSDQLPVATFDQLSRNENYHTSNRLKLGMDYYASNKTIAGIVVQGDVSNGRFSANSHANVLGPDLATDSIVTANTRVRGNRQNFSVNGNLRHSFDSTGKKITVDLDYVVYNDDPAMMSVSGYFLPDGSILKPSATLRGFTPSVINIYSGKVDFTLPMGRHQVEAGVKASRVETDNDALYQNKVDKDYETDFGKSNHFIYKEDILAAYVSWNYQLKKWGFQSGLRAEQTRSEGYQAGNAMVPDSSFSKSYLNLFPTAYVSFNADKKNAFGLNYGRRIQRPSYADMNPFMYFLDEYTYEAGNVFLQPQFTDRIELSHSFGQLLHSSIAYSHTRDVISEVLRQNIEKRITYQTKENIASATSLILSTGANFKTGKMLTSVIDLTLSRNSYEGQLESGYLDTQGWLFNGKLTEQANFGKGWAGEVSGFYWSSQVDAQMHIAPMWRVDASVQKTLFKDKGKLSLFVRDIFDSQHFSGTIRSNNIDVDIRSQRLNRNIGLSFSYRFGKPIKGLKQHQSGAAEDERSRVKTS